MNRHYPFVNGKVYFGEMTFYHFSGMVPFETGKWDYIFGEWINLVKEKTKEAVEEKIEENQNLQAAAGSDYVKLQQLQVSLMLLTTT